MPPVRHAAHSFATSKAAPPHSNPAWPHYRLLNEWCRHYGPVTWAANILNFGGALKVAKEVGQLQIRWVACAGVE